jgi:hypothetical protein
VGLRGELAHLQRDETAELVGAFQHKVPSAVHHPRALSHRPLAPGQERRLRFLHHGGDLVARQERILLNYLAGGGIHRREATLAKNARGSELLGFCHDSHGVLPSSEASAGAVAPACSHLCWLMVHGLACGR